MTNLVKKGIEDSNLGRNLTSSNNGSHGLLAVLNGTIKVLQLLGQQEATDTGLQELGHTLGGGVSPVSGTKGIVDEHIEGRSKLLNKSGLVLGLLLVESGVLEHDDIALLGGIDNLGNLVTNAVGGELDLLSQKFAHALGAGAEGEFVLRSVLGAAQVRADGDDGALALEVFDGGDGGADTGVIGDLLAVKGNVHVATDENLLALKVGLAEVLDGLLGIEGEVELGGGEGAEADGRGGGGEGSDGWDGQKSEGRGELHGE